MSRPCEKMKLCSFFPHFSNIRLDSGNLTVHEKVQSRWFGGGLFGTRMEDRFGASHVGGGCII
eukprot:scaffold1328_cov162-Amphora_coffeaeformis.AAC.28